MPTWREIIETSDPWSYYDYKRSFTAKQGTAGSWQAASWVPEEDQRRITAYHLLDDMCRNRGRGWMDPEVDEEDRQDHREYGDPAMIIHAVQSSVVGDSQTIVVEGSTEEDPNDPGPALIQQELLTEWLRDERVLVKMMSNELKCAKYGDQVYVLGWDPENQRPRLRCWDPGFLFMVLDDWTNEEDFPKRIHLAWEYEKKIEGKLKKFLRRITYDLRDDGPTVDYPWNALPVRRACWMRELEWDMQNIRSTDGLIDLDEGSAVEIKPDTNLGIDFMPVYHIPNFPAEDEHWGTSTLAMGLQIIDDLASVDSDLQAAAATTGSPPLSVEDSAIQPNQEGEIETYGPGQVFGGKISMIDTSRSLDALLKLKEALQERVEVNLRVPKTLIGRVDPSKIESGVILTLSFQPHSNMIRQMRLVRQDKYDLILKHVCRFYALNNQLDGIIPVRLKFGSYLPADRQEVGNIVREGITAHSMSLETAVALMMEAGYPIEDAQLEVLRIQAQNYDAASKALDASGDLDFSRGLLGLPPAPELETPEEETGAPPENVPGEVPLPA